MLVASGATKTSRDAVRSLEGGVGCRVGGGSGRGAPPFGAREAGPEQSAEHPGWLAAAAAAAEVAEAGGCGDEAGAWRWRSGVRGAHVGVRGERRDLQFLRRHPRLENGADVPCDDVNLLSS